MSPSDRFLVLSHLVDELPEDPAKELLHVVSAAMFAVVRHLQGRLTEAEARFALDRARDALRAARARVELERGGTSAVAAAASDFPVEVMEQGR